MSLSKDRFMEDQRRRALAQEEMPNQLDKAIQRIEELSFKNVDSKIEIEQLKLEITKANSIKKKLIDYLIGGIIGSVIGLIVGDIVSITKFIEKLFQTL